MGRRGVIGRGRVRLDGKILIARLALEAEIVYTEKQREKRPGKE